jgi:hypothetical protein
MSIHANARPDSRPSALRHHELLIVEDFQMEYETIFVLKKPGSIKINDADSSICLS